MALVTLLCEVEVVAPSCAGLMRFSRRRQRFRSGADQVSRLMAFAASAEPFVAGSAPPITTNASAWMCERAEFWGGG